MILKNVAAKRPDLIDFSPPPSTEDIERFECEFDFTLPERVKLLWKKWGTGIAFETESFFSPAEDQDTGESAFTVNREAYANGLSRDLVIFHRGLGGVTCIDKQGGVFQVEEDEFSIIRCFDSLEDWFVNCLLQAYESRYDLS